MTVIIDEKKQRSEISALSNKLEAAREELRLAGETINGLNLDLEVARNQADTLSAPRVTLLVAELEKTQDALLEARSQLDRCRAELETEKLLSGRVQASVAQALAVLGDALPS